MARVEAVKVDTKETSKVKPCTCSNEGQDNLYGKGNRLHNMKFDKSFICTVCGTVEGRAAGKKK
jgi:hypothetical protein